MNIFTLLWNGFTDNLVEPRDLRKFDQIVIDLKCSIISIAVCSVLWYCVIISPLNETTYKKNSVEYNSVINKVIDIIKHNLKK